MVIVMHTPNTSLANHCLRWTFISGALMCAAAILSIDQLAYWNLSEQDLERGHFGSLADLLLYPSFLMQCLLALGAAGNGLMAFVCLFKKDYRGMKRRLTMLAILSIAYCGWLALMGDLDSGWLRLEPQILVLFLYPAILLITPTLIAHPFIETRKD